MALIYLSTICLYVSVSCFDLGSFCCCYCIGPSGYFCLAFCLVSAADIIRLSVVIFFLELKFNLKKKELKPHARSIIFSARRTTFFSHWDGKLTKLNELLCGNFNFRITEKKKERKKIWRENLLTQKPYYIGHNSFQTKH